jgi:hypothetical protein
MRTTILQTLIFGRDGNAAPAQAHGWSGGEDGFTWTLGDESGLIVQHVESPYGFFVEMEISPLTRQPLPLAQKMELLVDGQFIARMAITDGGTYCFLVKPLARAGGSIELTIRHPDAIQPTPGGRMLAFAFRKLRILGLCEPPLLSQFARSAVRFDSTGAAAGVEKLLGIPASKLVLAFEMLAGNCEFGSMQRKCGVEPLSLLRFAGATATTAIDGLDSDFVGIGDSIEPHIASNPTREWMIRDCRYRLNYHTLISSNDVSAEQIVAMEHRKIRFLRRKFLEDLGETEKVLLCSAFMVTTPEAAMPLFLALRRKGKHRMLWVKTATLNTEEQPGTVVEIVPGLMLGYIDRFAPSDDGTDISVDGWLKVLANAWLLGHRNSEVDPTI